MRMRKKSLSPIKFNPKWMENEDFKNLAIYNWYRYNPTYGNSTMFQFAKKLKNVKRIIR